MMNLDSILKSRDITLPKKGPYSQSYGFSSSHVWIWELDDIKDWAPKNWYLRTVVLEKTLESPWIARRSNQSILKEISPEYSLAGLMLKHQYFGYLMWRANWLEKTLMLGKIESRRRKGWQRMRWLDGWHHWLSEDEFEQTPGDGEGQGSLMCCCPWSCKESDMNEWLNNNSSGEKDKKNYM